MLFKTFMAFFGIIGSGASIGVPIAVQELKRFYSSGGKEWAYSSVLTSLSRFSGAPNSESRKQICKELGGNNGQSSVSLASSGSDGNYGCNDGNSGNDLEEKLDSTFYTGNLKSKTQTIKCLSRQKRNSGSNTSMEVDGAQCRKQ